MDMLSYLLGKHNGGGSNLQNKEITINTNGSQTINPDTGYDGLKKVKVNTNVKYAPSYISFYMYGGNDLSNELNELDIRNMDGISSMFYYCNRLTSLDLSGWDTQNIKYAGSAFNLCSSLNNLNLSGWNTSNIREYSFMFENCGSLTTLDLSSFTIASTNNVRAVYMFDNCTHLSQLDMSNFDFTQLVAFQNMFDGVPTNCLIYVKDQTQVDWFDTNFPSLTNIQIKGA